MATGTITISDMYGANVAQSERSGMEAVAPDAVNVSEVPAGGGFAPILFWFLAIVGGFATYRVVWETMFD